MSAATKRKHVAREVEEELILPTNNQFVVRILAGKGNNLHEVETAHGDIFLASMPTKYRKSVWIKRGDYVICEPIEEGDKVKAEVVHVLYKDNIHYLRQQGAWPAAFDDQPTAVEKENLPVATETTKQCYNIDKDMLPPSSSDEEADTDSDSGSSGKPVVARYNPNYDKGIFATEVKGKLESAENIDDSDGNEEESE